MIPKLTITGVGDLRKKLEKVMDAAKSDRYVGKALKAGAEIFGDEIQAAMPQRRGTLKSSVKKGIRGRMTKNGPVYFAAVDRKAAPQGRFLHHGTRRQKARPEIFSGAIRNGRARARHAVQSELVRIAWEHL
jgi:HK97 gp10 family phage protein